MSNYLTPKQRAVYGYLRSYHKENGYFPTLLEIAAYVGLKNASGARYQVQQLQERGYIRQIPGKHRSMELTLVSALEPAKAPEEAGKAVLDILNEAMQGAVQQNTERNIAVLQEQLAVLEARKDVKKDPYVGGYRNGVAMAIEWLRRANV